MKFIVTRKINHVPTPLFQQTPSNVWTIEKNLHTFVYYLFTSFVIFIMKTSFSFSISIILYHALSEHALNHLNRNTRYIFLCLYPLLNLSTIHHTSAILKMDSCTKRFWPSNNSSVHARVCRGGVGGVPHPIQAIFQHKLCIPQLNSDTVYPETASDSID